MRVRVACARHGHHEVEKTGTLMSRIVLTAMLLCLLSGCGQKGDLYLPDGTDKKQDFVTR